MRLILQDVFWVAHMPLVRIIKFQFLAQSHSCLVLWSFSSNLLYSLIVWLIASSLSSYNLHLLFCWVLSTFPFNIVGPYGDILYCYQKRFSLSPPPSLSLSQGFPFLTMSKSSCVRFYLFVAWNIHTVIFLPICFQFMVVLSIIVLSVLFLVAVISLSVLFFM